MATPEQIDQLRWFVATPNAANQDTTAENAALIMDLIRAGLLFRNAGLEVSYDVTPLREIHLAAAVV